MWARFAEIILSLWLFSSQFIFPLDIWEGLPIALLILLFASLSFVRKLNKMHLFQFIPAIWLLHISYSYPTPFLPFGYQNFILIAISLLMFALIPSHASKPPSPWEEFLNGNQK